MLPFGPAVMPTGVVPGAVFSVSEPAVVIVPTYPLPGSVSHKLRSGPTVISAGPAPLLNANSVKAPAVVTLATLSKRDSVNHKFPSGPATMPLGWLFELGIVYSVNTPAVASLPILLVL